MSRAVARASHLTLRLAATLDRFDARVHAVAERLGYAPWLDEFRTYLNDPRLTLEEFWGKYARIREQANFEIQSEEDIRTFYKGPYMLWRNLVHRRHTAWRRVLWTMKGRRGKLLEIGCGIAPVSAWCRHYKPGWRFCLQDIPSPHYEYAKWRLKDQVCVYGKWNVVTALDVFEHLQSPIEAAHRAVNGLAKGGYFHWNFVPSEGVGLNRATAWERDVTLKFLEKTLEPVWETPEHKVGRKR